MNTTQSHLSIIDIKDNLVLLKDGSVVLILKVSAVNFGLLSEMEQVAIIDSFAALLNSLSFSIQIIIHSTRLDINSYLHTLDKAISLQTNFLLSQLMSDYRNFIQSTIKDNQVLDKKFYLALSVSPLELGIGVKAEDKFKKAKMTLAPRRDQILRQLSRVGLKGIQLNSFFLLKLFYEIYNPPSADKAIQLYPVVLANPTPRQTSLTPPANPPTPPITTPMPAVAVAPLRHNPFVVEELTDSL